MTRTVRRRSKKAGLPPGTLMYTGDTTVREVRIVNVRYSETGFEERAVASAAECLMPAEDGAVTWVDVDGVHQTEIIKQLGECFGLHPLVAEDIANTDQRAKIENYGDHLYIVLKTLYRDESHWIRTEQVSIVLGRSFILSFHEGRSAQVFSAIRDRLRSGQGRIRKMGADFLLHALLDAIVDNYFVVMEETGEQIEELEDHLIAGPSQAVLKTIHVHKRKLIFLRRSVWPLREVLSSLVRRESSLISDSASTYLRDVYDHTIQVIDAIEAYRDILAGMLDIYLTSINNRLNEIMKVLTVITVIFMPLSFIAGIYGMNFKHMPELEWTWGYPAVLTLLAGLTAGMLYYFKRRKWL